VYVKAQIKYHHPTAKILEEKGPGKKSRAKRRRI
jgi:hypothetical protein